MKVYIADAFTCGHSGGNPAGVAVIPDGEKDPGEEEMLRVAAELHFSETAFVRPTGNGDFRIRYFTPVAEVDLCGHATVASLKVLRSLGMIPAGVEVFCHTLAGKIPALVTEGDGGAGEKIFMGMAVPRRISVLQERSALQELYGVMGLSFVEQEAGGLSLLPEIVSTGLPDILMPVLDEEDLHAVDPDFRALSALTERYDAVGVHAFAVARRDGAWHVRNFAPLYDIDEESATGTANGALTYYGCLHGLIRPDSESVFVQGEKLGRTSRIFSRIKFRSHDEVMIQVGGEAVIREERSV